MKGWIPVGRIPRLIELVSAACRKAATDNDERSYELWTAVRSELNDALKTPAIAPLTGKDAALLPGLREALKWKPNTPQLANAMTYAWEAAIKSFISAIEKNACPKCGGETYTAKYGPDCSAGCDTSVLTCRDCGWQGEPE